MKNVAGECIRYLKLLAGSIVYAVGIGLFLNPNNMAPGGVTGISILLNRFTFLPVGTWSLLINIPIMLIGWWKLGKKMMLSTIAAVVFSSFGMNILEKYPAVTTDRILAATAGAVCVAIGIGTVFKAGGTTGGMDVIIRCIKKKSPYIKTGTLFLISDMIVIVISAIVFKDFEIAMYAAISAMICSIVLDIVLYGRDEAKLLFVISEKEKEITKRILEEIDIGVTRIQGTGAYTGKQRPVLMCVMRKHRMPGVSRIVAEIDDKAFMIVSSASEIYGEGYKSYHGGQL